MEARVWFEQKEEGTVFYRGDRRIGVAVSEKGCRDHFVPLEEGVYRWDRRTEEKTGEACMRFEAEYAMTYEMSPAFMYQENRSDTIWDYNKVRRVTNLESDENEEIAYFQGCVDEKTGKPWRISWWHMSIPGATFSEGEQESVGMFLPPDQLDAAASLYPEGAEKTVHEMIWPEQDMPRIPLTKKDPLVEPAGIPGKIRSGAGLRWGEGRVGSIEPRSHFAVILVLNEVKKPELTWKRMMDVSWKIFRKEPFPKFSNAELWDLGVSYSKTLFCQEENGFGSFVFGLMWVDGKWTYRPLFRYELGWCGQAASTAVSILTQALENGDKEAGELAFKTLDSWVEQKLPCGLPKTHLWDQEYTYFGRRMVDACNLSAGAIQYFQAWKLAEKLGKDKPEYFDLACAVCDFAVEKMDETGRLGKSWAEDDLSLLKGDGTTGAFLTVALCFGVRYTGRKEYLEAAKKSFWYYYDEFMRQGYTMGGAQDIFTIDKESAIPLLKAALLLQDLTEDPRYLVCAENAAYYLYTWQWVYSRPLTPGSALYEAEYNTYGGTSVSMMGAGQDPYGLFYVNELYDLAERTGNAMWADRAHALWCNGHDGVSDGTLVVNDRPIPLGGQHEARGVGSPDDHYLYQWLVSWPNAFRMENLRRTLFPEGDRAGRAL